MTSNRGEASYRWLLALFPGRFRAEHEGELLRLFADMRSEWEEERGRAGVRFWLGLVWDTGRAAALEWLSVLGDTIRRVAGMTMGEHMSALFGDVKFAARQLVRQPFYSIMVIGLMAFGIAANAAVFRVFNGLFLKPLPFDAPEQLVDINETAPAWDLEFLEVSYPDFVQWRERTTTLQSIAAYDGGGGTMVTEDGAERVSFISTTHDIDEVLRLEPTLGRFYGPEEDQPDGPRGGLLSHGYWTQRFAADPSVLGRTVTVNGFSIEIIGVLPPEARFLRDADMWFPLRGDPDAHGNWGLQAIGRMEPGATPEQVLADLTSIHKSLIPDFPVNEISSPTVHTLRDRYLGDYRLGSGFLLGAVAIVLLIACANIAGLMTARSVTRAPEMSVRRAMGAPRGRIVRQLLTESLVLGSVGAALGVALGARGSELLVGPLSDQFPAWVTFDLDMRFIAFTVAITLGAAILFGLAPALQASGASAGSLTNRTTASSGRRRAMSLLVTGEVALALILLVVGGLTVLDVRELSRLDPGFESEGLASYVVSLPTYRYEDDASRVDFFERYLERLEAIPDVRSAAATSALPLSGHWGWFFVVDGAPPRAEDEANPVVLNRVVSADYFETVGVQFVAGRPFDEFDGREGGSPVVIVNESFVASHLSHLDDPVGARVVSGTAAPTGDAHWMTVVGVTRDVLHYGVDEPMRPGVYQPMPQLPRAGFQIAISTEGELEPIMAEARALTAEMDVELPVFQATTMAAELDESLYTRRAISLLIGIFSAAALLMAIAGVYGVISYSVGQRGQEISIRMAMGAHKGTVLRDVVLQGMRLVGFGAAIGLVLSLAGARVVSGILVGVSATNPWVYVAVTALVIVVAAAANYLPARRAAGTNPMRALRGE